MILVVDIGNTHIVLGAFDGDELKFVFRISTDPQKTEYEYASIVRNIFILKGIDMSLIEGAAMSCVVPQLTQTMKKALKLCFGINAVNVGPGVKTGINLNCDSPAQVGADLICSCVAAHELYGENCIVIDMGTATKLIAVDKNGVFIGLSIAPGLGMGMNALAMGTAQLPQVSLDAPDSVLGKNTQDCMKSGVVVGHACMIDGMVDRMLEELGGNWRVIVTGGFSSIIAPLCKRKTEIDETFILKGLRAVYTKNRK